MKEESPRVTVRMRPQLLARVDAYAASLDVDAPGLRGVAIRKLVALGLGVAEKDWYSTPIGLGVAEKKT